MNHLVHQNQLNLVLNQITKVKVIAYLTLLIVLQVISKKICSKAKEVILYL